jgi:hypothetical protein
MLLALWSSSSSAVISQGNEAEICRGSDGMLELAFQLRNEAKHIVQ